MDASFAASNRADGGARRKPPQSGLADADHAAGDEDAPDFAQRRGGIRQVLQQGAAEGAVHRCAAQRQRVAGSHLKADVGQPLQGAERTGTFQLRPRGAEAEHGPGREVRQEQARRRFGPAGGHELERRGVVPGRRPLLRRQTDHPSDLRGPRGLCAVDRAAAPGRSGEEGGPVRQRPDPRPGPRPAAAAGQRAGVRSRGGWMNHGGRGGSALGLQLEGPAGVMPGCARAWGDVSRDPTRLGAVGRGACVAGRLAPGQLPRPGHRREPRAPPGRPATARCGQMVPGRGVRGGAGPDLAGPRPRPPAVDQPRGRPAGGERPQRPSAHGALRPRRAAGLRGRRSDLGHGADPGGAGRARTRPLHAVSGRPRAAVCLRHAGARPAGRAVRGVRRGGGQPAARSVAALL